MTVSERLVAERAIQLSRGHPSDSRRAHVGYYLVDSGVAELERALGYRSPPGEALHQRFVALWAGQRVELDEARDQQKGRGHSAATASAFGCAGRTAVTAIGFCANSTTVLRGFTR